MRTKAEIIKEMNQVQNVCDRLKGEIGISMVRNDDKTNHEKTVAFQKAEAQLRLLDKELANASE